MFVCLLRKIKQKKEQIKNQTEQKQNKTKQTEKKKQFFSLSFFIFKKYFPHLFRAEYMRSFFDFYLLFSKFLGLSTTFVYQENVLWSAQLLYTVLNTFVQLKPLEAKVKTNAKREAYLSEQVAQAALPSITQLVAILRNSLVCKSYVLNKKKTKQ